MRDVIAAPITPSPKKPSGAPFAIAAVIFFLRNHSITQSLNHCFLVCSERRNDVRSRAPAIMNAISEPLLRLQDHRPAAGIIGHAPAAGQSRAPITADRPPLAPV
jgi:hypothetical protein